jgi:hypothetical protein
MGSGPPWEKADTRCGGFQGKGLELCRKMWLCHRESILVIVVFISQNNNNVRVLVYCSRVKMCKFLAVRRVGLMTHGKRHVDRPFLYHVIRCWVRTNPPLLYGHWVAYLTPFLRLNPQTPKRCHMDLWLHAWFSFVNIIIVTTPPFCNNTRSLEYFDPWINNHLASQ